MARHFSFSPILDARRYKNTHLHALLYCRCVGFIDSAAAKWKHFAFRDIYYFITHEEAGHHYFSAPPRDDMPFHDNSQPIAAICYFDFARLIISIISWPTMLCKCAAPQCSTCVENASHRSRRRKRSAFRDMPLHRNMRAAYDAIAFTRSAMSADRHITGQPLHDTSRRFGCDYRATKLF